MSVDLNSIDERAKLSPSNPAALNAMAVLLASLSLGWISLANFGGLGLRPIHLVFCFLVPFIFTVVDCSKVFQLSQRHPANLLAGFFAFYVAAMSLSCFRPGVDSMQFLTLMGKDAAYFAMFYILCFLIGRLRDDEVAIAFYRGSAWGVALFLLTASAVFAKMGRNFCSEYFAAFVSGDHETIRRSIYWSLFQYLAEVDDETLRVNLLNTVVSCFSFYLLSVWVYRPIADDLYGRSWSRMIRWSLTVTCVVMVIGTTSRTNCAALLVAIALANILAAMAKQSTQAVNNAVAVLLVSLMSFVFLCLTAFATLDIDEKLADRFGWDKLSSDPRWAMYQAAIKSIPEHWLAGYGFGATVYAANDDYRVHNFCLAAWYEGGVFAFAASVALVGYIVWVWWKNLTKFIKGVVTGSGRISYAWIFALPVLPLLKLAFYAGGVLPLVDWCMLALFFAVLGQSSPDVEEANPSVNWPRVGDIAAERKNEIPNEALN